MARWLVGMLGRELPDWVVRGLGVLAVGYNASLGRRPAVACTCTRAHCTVVLWNGFLGRVGGVGWVSPVGKLATFEGWPGAMLVFEKGRISGFVQLGPGGRRVLLMGIVFALRCWKRGCQWTADAVSGRVRGWDVGDIWMGRRRLFGWFRMAAVGAFEAVCGRSP